MGLRIGRFLGKVARVALPVGAGMATGGLWGGAMAGLQIAGRQRGGGAIGAGVHSSAPAPGFFWAGGQQVPINGEEPLVQPVAAGTFAVVGMTRTVAMAITKIATAMGIPLTLAKLSRVGMRLWSSVTALARRHPGLSIIGFLTGLGLAADEAAEFLFWGQSKKRRRRGRGITARDIRTSRRTIRKIAAFQRDLGGMRRGPRARRFGRGGGGGVVIAQQD